VRFESQGDILELDSKQLEFFEENGYLVVRDFVSKERCDTIRDVALAHLRHKVPPIETESEYNDLNNPSYQASVRRLRQVYDRDIVFKEWMEEGEIRPILRQILHDDPVIVLAHHNSIMTKMPHTSTQTSWHQDKRYWRYESDNLVSVWLALGEENSHNGVLEFIPASHKMELGGECFGKKEYFKDDYLPNQKLIATKVSEDLHQGDVVFFHCKLLHRANENKSDEAKISFVYTLKGGSNRAIDGSRSSQYREIRLK